MSRLLEKNELIVQEHYRTASQENYYDLLDAVSGEMFGTANEKYDGRIVSFLKRTHLDSVVPFEVKFNDVETGTLFSLKKKWTYGRTKIDVINNNGKLIGSFYQPFPTWKTKFLVKNENNEIIARLKGDLYHWNFNFLNLNGDVIGHINKNWGRTVNELIVSLDSYKIKINDNKIDKNNTNIRCLILAAAVCIDIIYKKHQ